MNTNITMENLSQFEQAFDQNPVNAVAMNAVTANGTNACAQNYQIPRKDVHEFSVSLKQLPALLGDEKAQSRYLRAFPELHPLL